LTNDMELAKYFEALFALTWDAKKSCSYITTILLALINESDEKIQISELKFDICELASVIDMVNKDELSSINSKEVVAELFKNGWNALEITDKLWLRQKNDVESLMKVVDQVIAQFPSQIEEYKWGNEKLFWFFVGQCMKLSAGQGNPKIFNDLLKERI
jgi:aspartyl-tRNA(Asn)/glutamyl-tRNA(Gln) amidotransferase subunit B